jgi:NADH:ubiquinone reductase (H+-translocating)
MMRPPRILIVGGGFAGVACARTLRKRLPPAAEIVVFNRENHMVFHPLLPEVAGASLNPDAVAAPLRQMLAGVRCRTEDVTEADVEGKTVGYVGDDGHPRQMPYDHLVLACGRQVNLGMVPGMADHAIPLKTIGDAMALRSHVMQRLESADMCEEPERRRWLLTTIVVGGGFSGVEAAGEINDLLRSSRRYFPHLRGEEIRVTLVHSRDELLPEVGPTLRATAEKRMRRMGVDVVLGARVAAATAEGVWLADGRTLRGATIVCTIGTSATAVVERLKASKDKGSILTEPDMRIRGFGDAWAAGDCATIINAFDGEPSPPTGQFAERQGRQVAENIARVLRGEPTRPFHHKPLGQLCSIGGRTAVAEVMGMRAAGFLSWCFWRGVYLSKLPSWSKRVRVGLAWTWELVFPRELLYLRTSATERVSHAYFQPGEYVFRAGDQATSLYIIEKGEVEILRPVPGDGDAQLVAVLGPGDFFGEMALVEQRPRSAGARARTPLEVVVMGRNVFTQVSASLAPLRDIVSESVRRRNNDMWLRLPFAHEILSREPLATFIEPPPAVRLRPESSLMDAARAFTDNTLDLCCVLDEREWLCGIVTRSDLLRGVDLIVSGSANARSEVRVRDFMRNAPIMMPSDASSIATASTIRERGLKTVPVVVGEDDLRLVGYVRAHRLLSWVLEQSEGAPWPLSPAHDAVAAPEGALSAPAGVPTAAAGP